jgi:HPt (histidine-containing phosphotransfer) domain-containing protein
VATPIDQATFAKLLEMTGGDQAFVDELVDTYLVEGDRLVEELIVAATARATDDMVRPVHSLKSSSLNVGALELGELCRKLEEDARGGDVADPVGRANEVKVAFAEARAALLEERLRRFPG